MIFHEQNISVSHLPIELWENLPQKKTVFQIFSEAVIPCSVVNRTFWEKEDQIQILVFLLGFYTSNSLTGFTYLFYFLKQTWCSWSDIYSTGRKREKKIDIYFLEVLFSSIFANGLVSRESLNSIQWSWKSKMLLKFLFTT